MTASAQRGNPVEPLSNGLALSMTADEVTARFGRPVADDRYVGGGFSYQDFTVLFDAHGNSLWHLTIKGPGVRLNSGVAVSSRRADGEQVFGSGDHAIVDQYDLSLQYDRGDVVRQMYSSPQVRAAKYA